jgi:hypothetical protein
MTGIRPPIASDVAAIVRVADDDYLADGPGAGDVDDALRWSRAAR